MPHLKKIISVCVSKEKQEKFFFNRETHTRIIVIDLIIVKLFKVCPAVFFSLKRNCFPHKFFVFVCNYYLGLLILLIILFGTQHFKQ